VKKIENPYAAPAHTWSPELMAAYQSFPLDKGHTAPICEATEELWREWCRKHDRKFWPGWILEYSERKRIQEEARAAGSHGLRKSTHT
jgi:hypothetical protein